MVPQLLALGDSAEVIEPADVRDRIRAEARAILRRYKQQCQEKPRARKPLAK